MPKPVRRRTPRRAASPSAISPGRQLIPLTEGAERAGCSVKTIRRYIAAGTITGYRFGPKLLRVDAAELDALARPIPTAGGAA